MQEQGYLYLDVRSAEECALGHPEGAYNVPLRLRTPQGMRDNPDFVRVVVGALGTDARLVVGCQSGVRSLTAAELLLQAGLTSVVELRAGFEGRRDAFGRALEPGWRAAGLPCATELLPGRNHDALARAR